MRKENIIYRNRLIKRMLILTCCEWQSTKIRSCQQWYNQLNPGLIFITLHHWLINFASKNHQFLTLDAFLAELWEDVVWEPSPVELAQVVICGKRLREGGRLVRVTQVLPQVAHRWRNFIVPEILVNKTHLFWRCCQL